MKRLEGILSQIKPADNLVDIGSDHGYLAKMILDKGLAKKIYVTDVAEGPLSRAKDNLSGYSAEFLLMDGLRGFQGCLDVAVLAGMGGELIAKIIRESEELFSHMDYFIVQPMQQIASLREALYHEGYRLISELLVHEERFYEILTYEKGQDVPYPFELSKGLYPDKDLYREYLREKEKKLQYILEMTSGVDEVKYKDTDFALSRMMEHCKKLEIML